jgi:hypothetical protein
VHGLEAEYSGRINFSYLDIDDPATDPFKQALGYRYQPNIFLLDGEGYILHQWIGSITRDQLVSAFEANLYDFVNV